MNGEKAVEIDATQHAVKNMDILERMRKDGEGCDFHIRIGTVEIPSHRLILSTRSEYFAAMFKHENVESNTGSMEMKEVDAESVEKCIVYIYTGKASVSPENIGKLLHVSVMMQLDELTAGLVKQLRKGLSPASFFRTKRWSVTYSCKDLERECDEFAFANFGAISVLDEFVELERNYVIFLLNSKINRSSNGLKCDAVMKWTKHDVETRKDFFLEMLQGVDLSKVPLRRLKQYVDREVLIHGSMDAMKLFTQAFFKVDNVKTDTIIMLDKSLPSLFALTPDPSGIYFNQLQLHEIHKDVQGQVFEAVATADHIYVILSTNVMYRTSVSDDATWEKMESMPPNGGILSVVAEEDRVYVIDKNRYVQSFDIVKNKWEKNWPAKNSTAGLQAQQQLMDASAAVLNGTVYVIGGRYLVPNANQQNYNYQYYTNQTANQYRVTNQVQSFSHGTTAWQSSGQMQYARYGAATAIHNGHIYVLGGYTNRGSMLTSVECYDPSVGRWGQLSCAMSTPRAFFSACFVDGRLYAVGGNEKKPQTMENVVGDGVTWEMDNFDAGLKCFTMRTLV